jgi:hypothetical protein
MPDASAETAPRPYATPCLTRFGSIASLTAGGSVNGMNEFGPNPNMMGMAMGGIITCDDPNFMAPGMWC